MAEAVEELDPFEALIPDPFAALVDDPFEELIPSEPLFGRTEKEIGARAPFVLPGTPESDTPLARISEAIQEQAVESFGEIGLEPDTERFIKNLSRTTFGPETINLFGIRGQNPLRFVGEKIFEGAANITSVVVEGMMATFQTAVVGAGQIVAEATGNKEDGTAFIRDLGMPLGVFAMFAGGGAGLRPPAPRPRAISKAPKSNIFEEGPLFETDLVGVKAPSVGKTIVKKSEVGKKLSAEKQAEVAEILDEGIESARLKIGNPAQIAKQHNLSIPERALAIFDPLVPIKKIAEQAGEPTPFRDMRLLNGLRGVLQAVHERGTIARATEDFVFEGRRGEQIPVRKGDIYFNGKGFDEVIAPIEGKLDRWIEFMVGKRAGELLTQGREKLFTQREIDALKDVGEDLQLFESVAEEFQLFNDRILDFAVDSGYLSPIGKAAMREANQQFISFERALGEGVKGKRGPAFKILKGGTANLGDVFQNTVKNFGRIIEQSLINDAKLKVFTQIDRLKLDTFARKLDRTETAELKAIEKTIIKDLVEQGMTEATAERLARPLTVSKSLGNREVVFRNGHREIYEINDPYMMRAMRAGEPESLPFVIRILSGFTNVLRAGVTLAPEFFLYRNLVRDVGQSVILSERAGFVAPFRAPLDAIGGMKSRLLRDENYWLALANGGGFSTLYKGEVLAARRLRSRYEKAGINPANVLDTLNKVVGEVTGLTEEAVRLGEFKSIVAQGGSLREATGGLTGTGGFRGISTDFGIRSPFGPVRNLLLTLPFANARIQGLIRIGRAMADNPATVATKGLVAITIPALTLYFLNKDDPTYRALDDWIKDQHYVFIKDNGDVILVPKGFEAGAIFATAPERLFEVIEERNGKRFANAMLRMVTETFSLDIIPQAVRPVDELRRNENFFGAIVPKSLEGVKPSEQFRPGTSETMVELAKILSEDMGIEVSPIQAQSLVRGYLGTLGIYALDGADYLIGLTEQGEKPTRRLDETPLVRALLREQPLRTTQYQDDFYELLTESRMVAATVSKMKLEGRAPDLDGNEINFLGLLPVLNKIASRLSEINKNIRLIRADKRMGAERKRRQIDELISARNDILEALINSLPKDVAKEYGILQK